MKAIIIDDETKGRQALSQLVGRYTPHVEIVGEAEGVQKGKELIEELANELDLVFLDIQMGDGTGFELLEQLSEINFQVIFVTAFDEYAVKAFQCSAIDYLLKPVDPELMISAVHKVHDLRKQKALFSTQMQALKSNQKTLKKIAINTQEGVDLIDIKDIIRLEASSNYTIIYLDNKTTIVSTKTLKEYENMLSEQAFYRIHKSHLIHLDRVKRYSNGGSSVIMTDDVEVEVARRRKDAFLKVLLNRD